MNEENVIVIDGKTINFGDMSGEKMLSLYKQLKEREIVLLKKIVKLRETYDFLPEINLNEIIG